MAAHNRAELQIRTFERQADVLRFRRAGLSFSAIGKQLGITTTSVRRLIEQALTKEFYPQALAIRAEELAHLDALREGLRAGWEAGEPASVSAAIRVAERKAKILGLDADQHSTVEITAKPYVERDVLLAEARSRAAVAEALNRLDESAVLELEPVSTVTE